MKIPIANIQIRERQRKDLGDISELADSLQRLGQIHNIGVTPDMRLIWGMRRLTAAKSLGWTEIEATVRDSLTPESEQETELEEDIKRKDRTWQEKCLAVAKLFRIKARAARAMGETWTCQMMASFTGQSRATVQNYVYTLAEALDKTPRDEALWAAAGYTEALAILRDRAFNEAQAELERRRQVNLAYAKQQPTESPTVSIVGPTGKTIQVAAPIAGSSQQLAPTIAKIGMTHVSLRDRAMFYNTAYAHLWKQQLTFRVNPKDPTEQFIEGWWFVGGGNISDLYGAYQVEYLADAEGMIETVKKYPTMFNVEEWTEELVKRKALYAQHEEKRLDNQKERA